MLFVSYAYFTETKLGYGDINLSVEGFYSAADVEDAVKTIEAIEKDFRKGENVKVVILNWRKYDPAP